MSSAVASPHVVGQWVSGERFYGRQKELAASLEGPGWIWWAGLRRVGKTSLLKQIEHLCAAGAQRTVSLFWDLQGVDGEGELALTFTDALLDAEEALAAAGIAVEDLESEDLWLSLDRLLHALTASGTELLLLLDEADDLRLAEAGSPGTLPRLWQRLQTTDAVRVVLASSVRLVDRCAAGELPSVFREPFGPARHLGPLSVAAGQSLLCQSQLPIARRPEISTEAAAELGSCCGGHPLLLQMAGRRYVELGEVEETCRQLIREPSVAAFLAVDFELLNATERNLLRSLATSPGAPQKPSGLGSASDRLRDLGWVRAAANGTLEIAHPVLLSWLQTGPRT